MNKESTQVIYEAFEAWTAAWNNGDLGGYLTCYWESEQTRYISNGKIIQGHAAIVAHYQSRFEGVSDFGQLELRQLDVELIGERDALVIGRFYLTRNNTAATGTFTAHLRQRDDQWLIALDHTSSKM